MHRFSTTVLAVNPSYSTPGEREFWSNLSSALDARSWSLVEIAARRIAGAPNADTIIMCARLAEFAKDEPDVGLPPWASEELIDLHTDWELRRWQEGHDPEKVRRGVRRLVGLVDVALTRLRPSIVLTTNKIDHPCAFFRTAAKYYGVNVGVVERSPFDSIWYEDNGIFTESGIWNHSRNHGDLSKRASKHSRSVLDAMVDNPAGFRQKENSDQRPELDVHEGTTVFVPLDNMLWTGWEQLNHPQGDVDYPIFRNPVEALRAVKRSIDQVGGKLILKKHPSCKFNIDLDDDIAACLVEGELGFLLSKADVVVAFNTKLVFPAIANGIPVVTLAPNPVAASGATYHCEREDQLSGQLHQALQRTDWDSKLKHFQQFCGDLDQNYFYQAHDQDEQNRPGPMELVDRLIMSATDLRLENDTSSGVAALESIERLARGRKLVDELRGTVKRFRNKPRLLLEVNRLFVPQLANSGIARYNRELANRLRNSDELDVGFVITVLPRQITRKIEKQRRIKLEEELGQQVVFLHRNDADAQAQLNQNGKFDLFHSTHGPFPAVGADIARNRLITIHDVVHIKHPQYSPKPWGIPHIKSIIDSIDKTRDSVICVSDFTRHDLVEFLDVPSDRMHVVTHGYDTDSYGFREPGALEIDGDTGPVVLQPHSYVVQMYQSDIRKNSEVSFDVLSRAVTRYAGLKMVVIASRPEAVKEIRTLATRYCVDDSNLIVVSAPDDATLCRLYNGALCFLYLTLYEGFGLPILEAMASGCPVVTSDVSSLPQAGGSAPIYCDPGNRNSAVDAIGLLFQNPSLRSELARNGMKETESATWKRAVDRTVEVYERILG